jgi:two-component system invasion response regulator UvrY
MEKISLIIVDDHSLLRDTWSYLLNQHKRFNVVATTGRGEEAVELCRKLKPNIVMMDINLPGMNGIDATKEIRRISPYTKIVGVSLHSQPAYARKMMTSGASGYITKNSPSKEMIEGLLEVANGNKYICNEIKNILSEELLAGEKKVDISLLSVREQEIVEKIAKGESSKEIAAALYISVKTVEVHRYHIFKKLNVRNVAALVNYITTHPL